MEVDLDLEVHPKGKGDKLKVPKMGKRPKGKKYTVMSVSGGGKKKKSKKDKEKELMDRGYWEKDLLAEDYDLSKPIDVDAEMPTMKPYDQEDIQRVQKQKEGDSKHKKEGKNKKRDRG